MPFVARATFLFRPIDRVGTRLRRVIHMLALYAAILGSAALGTLAARTTDPNALWRTVHDRCVPGARAGDPAPCAEVDLSDGEARGSAVLKDLVGRTQFLLIPTARLTGIEEPALLAPGMPNYFAAAWQARGQVELRVGHPLPRDAVGLAINSRTRRSQDQLHIHVDCLRPDVRDALRGRKVGERWQRLPVPLAGTDWLAMRLLGDRLDRDPFRLLADGVPGAREAMGNENLVVTGTAPDEPPGFVLLANTGGYGNGESLQDHGCAIAQEF